MSIFSLSFEKSKARIEEIVDNLGPDELFCDPDFPADSQALFYSEDKHSAGKTIVWKRPKVNCYLRYYFNF